MGNRAFWVCKDPLTREYYYFDEREIAILNLLDGRRTVSEVVDECSTQFSPDYVSAESIVDFLADAQRKGLLEPRDHRPIGDRTRRWWHQPLAIRLPGIHPEPILKVIGPPLGFVFTPLATVIVAAMVLVAALIVTVRFDTFVEHTALAASRLDAPWWVLLLLAVSATKIVHELGHALACRRFGGECREIGVMLLVGVPCLYCDVSDAWMLPPRWKRLIISLAGIGAELVVASIAAFVWLFAADGIVRDLCVTLMLVCSVSTIFFNGNPLLRYDGYFVLSDLLGIPNLAAESSGLIRQGLRRIVWGSTSLSAKRSPQRAVLLIFYGITSGIYRVAVLAVILMMLYRFAGQWQMGTVAGMVIVAWAGMLVFHWAKPIFAFPPQSMAGRGRSRRWTVLAGGAAAILLLAMMIPLPHSMVAPMSIRPAGGQTVFVTAPGQRFDSLSAGAQVSSGAVLAVLRNPETELEQLQQETQVNNLRAQLEGLHRTRVADRQSASRIPLVSEAIESAEKRGRARAALASRLTLRSPRSGKIFSPYSRFDSRSDREPRTWEETPLASQNNGAWFDEATEWCTVGDARAREAVVLVGQQNIPLVQPNQRVRFLMSDQRRGSVTGRVIEVSASPADKIPEEFVTTGWIKREADRRDTYYQVRVVLDDPEISLPVRRIGHVRIEVSPSSIANRIGRFVSRSFAF